MTAIFLDSDVSFSDTTIPLDYRDAGMDSATLFCLDLLDTLSWPSQAAPTAGAAIADLMGIANGAVSAVVPTWSNGFSYALGSLGYINLPPSSALSTSVVKFATAVWVKFTDLSGTNKSVLTMGKAGSGYTNTQYLVFTNGTQLKWNADGGAATRTVPITLATGTIYQIGYSVTLSGSTYTHTLWVNNAALDSFTTTSPMADPLTMTAARLGAGDLFGGCAGLVAYRANANALTNWTAAQFMAADYQARSGQFS